MMALRVLLAVVLWPFVHIADRVRHIDPPASFRVGLAWALRGDLPEDGAR